MRKCDISLIFIDVSIEIIKIISFGSAHCLLVE